MKSICPVHSEKGEAAIYQYLLHSVAADYETVRVMKTGPRGSVLLLQNKMESGWFFATMRAAEKCTKSCSPFPALTCRRSWR